MFSFLSSYLFASEFVHGIKHHIGVEYVHGFFVHSHGQVDFYRSEREEKDFNRSVGEKCATDDRFLQEIQEELHSLTDEFSLFLAKNREITKENIDNFLTLHERHLAYHLAVYWAAEHLSTVPQTEKTKVVLAILNKARLYNEKILPDVEKWLEKQHDILLFTRAELLNYIHTGEKINERELSERDIFSYVFMSKDETHVSTAEAAREKLEESIQKYGTKHSFENAQGAVRGVGINKGVYTGVVQKIELPKDFPSFKAGSVLVTRTTRPHYNHYLQTAGAIIADEGAFLSHTAVLAREFNIPTIIGTKIATKVFKNGDVVEVDADIGVVKIIT